MNLPTTQGRLSVARSRIIALTLLVIMIPAATFSRNIFGEPGSAVLVSVLLSGSFLILGRAAQNASLPRRLLIILLAAAPVIIIYAVSTLFNPSPIALSNTAQIILVVGFMTGLTLIRWEWVLLKPLFWIFSAILFLHVFWWFMAGTPLVFRGFMSHPNSLGLFALLLGFVPFLVFLLSPHLSAIKYVAALSALSSVVLLYATGSRATWLAAVFALVTFTLWPFFSRTRFRFHVTFLLVVIIAFAGTWLYLLAPNNAWGQELQKLSVQYTEQNFFSGRQLFWGDLERAISNRPWLGHGAGSVAETFTGYTWSSHNLYLQTALQVGLIGLSTLILLLWVIWGQLWRGRQSTVVRISGAYFLGVLIHEVFEVSLTQNNLANGLPIWLILALGLSYAWRAPS